MSIMHQKRHLFPYKTQILQLQTYTNKAERRASTQAKYQSANRRLSWFLGLNFFRWRGKFPP